MKCFTAASTSNCVVKLWNIVEKEGIIHNIVK